MAILSDEGDNSKMSTKGQVGKFSRTSDLHEQIQICLVLCHAFCRGKVTRLFALQNTALRVPICFDMACL